MNSHDPQLYWSFLAHPMARVLLTVLMLAVPLTPAPAGAASQRQVVLISDLHVGAGRDKDQRWLAFEDFRWQKDFDAFLASLARPGAAPTDLVLTGDVFELWQSPTMVCSSDIGKPGCQVPDCNESDADLGCSEAEAVARLAHVLQQHADFVAALRQFADRNGNRVYFVPGNHDAALLFPAVGQLLLDRFSGLRVSVQTQGYWLSEDGAIYADHGHQFDMVNAFPRWPQPFRTRADRPGLRFMAKPWGENMVQAFYNQYEYLFPIIDNLSQESAGVKYAIVQAGFKPSVEAVARFFRFYLYEQSLRQALNSLGGDDKKSIPEWDRAAVRAKPHAFFIAGLPAGSELAQAAAAAQRSGTLQLQAATLSDREIDALCIARIGISGVPGCPTTGRDLGGALIGLFFDDNEIRAAYLRDVLPRVAADAKLPHLATAIVFGHTHDASDMQPLSLGDLQGGPHAVQLANTGAFQRVVSPEQIETILAGTANANAPTRRAMDLKPEELPPCYNFVRIRPYQDKPRLELLRWAARRDGQFGASAGTCLTRPLD